MIQKTTRFHLADGIREAYNESMMLKYVFLRFVKSIKQISHWTEAVAAYGNKPKSTPINVSRLQNQNLRTVNHNQLGFKL